MDNKCRQCETALQCKEERDMGVCWPCSCNVIHFIENNETINEFIKFKRFEEIKHDLAKRYGFTNWQDLLGQVDEHDKYYNEAAFIYAGNRWYEGTFKQTINCRNAMSESKTYSQNYMNVTGAETPTFEP